MKRFLSLVVMVLVGASLVVGTPMTRFGAEKSAVYAATKYSTGYYKVTASEGLILRKGPGTSYSKQLTIPVKKQLKVTKVSGEWGKTSYSGKAGWVSLKYTKFVKSLVTSTADKYTAGTYKVTATDGLNLRKTASTSGAKLCTIKYKTKLNITKFSGNWGYTTYSSKKGWVSMNWVKFVSAAESEKKTSTTADSSIKATGVTKPSVLAVYEPFVLKGKITSKYKMVKVMVGICDSSKKWKKGFYLTKKPNKTTFNINSVDAKIVFNNLAKGTYYYKVCAKDSKGYSTCLIKKKFKVKASSTGYIWPYGSRSVITQYYKSYNWLVGHAGIDIAGANALGKSIKASRSGHVMTACYNSSYGYYIVILHSDNYSTVYAHCSKLLVKAGAKVTQGQVIGKVGSTGNSTGPHLHFEVRDKNGVKRNPLLYLP